MKTTRFAICISVVCAFFLAGAATLEAQNSLLLSATSLSFSGPAGGTPPVPQGLTLLSSDAALAYTAATSTVSGGTWLNVTPSSGTTPVTLVVSVNPGGLPAGTYSGSLVLTAAAASNSPVTVPVTLTVTGAAQLTVTPASLSFSWQSGAALPASQEIAIGSNGAAFNFTASVSTNEGGSWLLVNPLSGTTPQSLEVAVNPSGLAPGTYTGAVSVAASSASNSPVVVPVSVTVTANPQLTIAPGSVTFYFQSGGAAPAMQDLSITSSGAAISFGVTAATDSGGSWLVVSPASGATPASVAVGVNPSGLAPGTYTGNLTFTAPAIPVQKVPVTLVISSSPLLIVSAPSATFNFQIGGANPPTQSVSLTSTGPALPFSVSSSTTSAGQWLTVSKTSGNTPDVLSIGVNPLALQPGTYTGSVTLTAVGAGNNPQTIAVTLNVSNSVLADVFPGTLSFNFQTGGAAPAVQIVSVASTGAPLQFMAAAVTSSGGNWLSIAPTSGTSPASFNVAANPSGLAAGSYAGTITVTAAGAANSPVTIPVHLTVSDSALLNASPGALEFATTLGGPAQAFQTISLTSTNAGSPINFTVSSGTNAGGNWLVAGPGSGTTPSNLNVAVNASGLAAGAYTGSIVVTAPASANSPITIPVTLVVAPSAALAASPASLTFNQAFGGTPPATQNLAVTSSSGALSFSAVASTTVGGNWLAVAAAGGTTPGSVTVSVNGARLSQGAYTGSVTIIAAGAFNSPLTIPVSLVVGPPPPVAVDKTSLTFDARIAGPAPDSQAIAVSASGASVPFMLSVTTASGGPWLSASPSTGTTPATVTVAVNAAALTAGVYHGTIAIGSPTTADNPQTINVTLNLAAAVTPVIGGVENAATLSPQKVSPGLIITIFGTDIGPATPATLTLDGNKVSTTLGGTQVLFDQIPAPVIYASSTQVSAIVPYEVGGRFATNLQISFNGALSNTLQLAVGETSPGIFTLTATGSGQGAILNQDLSINGSSKPAAAGSIIVIYATGEGATNPPGQTGAITANATTFPSSDVSLTVAGVPARILYAGEAPGLVAGVLQVNAVLPQNVPSGPAAVVLTIGGVSSQPNVTVAVQ